MLTPDQEKEYNDLKEDVRHYSRYMNWHNYLDRYGGLFGLVFLLFLIVALSFPDSSANTYLFFAFIIVLLAVAIIENALEYVSRRNSPPVDRLILFYVYSAITNIDNYFNPKKAHSFRKKKEFRNKATRDGFILTTLVKNKWVVGKFGLAEVVFGKTLSDFKELLSKRLILTIRDGDPRLAFRYFMEIITFLPVHMIRMQR